MGVESTIIDSTQPPRLLRPGGLPLEALREVLGEVTVDKAVTPPAQGRRKAQGAGHEVPALRSQGARDSGHRRPGEECRLYPKSLDRGRRRHLL